MVYYGITGMVVCITMEKHKTTNARSKLTSKSSRGGRPRKFAEPTRPVTVTIPDRTLKQLVHIDKDRAKAIAKAVNMAVDEVDVSSSTAEIIHTDTK
jgi:hypothetical protein